MLPRYAAIATALLSCAACGGADGGADVDAGAPDGATPGPNIPWLAEGEPPVAPPVLTPCPSGWRETTDDDGTVCEPYPAGGAPSCAPGEAFFPGDGACTVVGTPCPSGDFADGLADDGSVVFVREGATGGDGSRASPYGSLAEVALSTIGDGRTLALARGSYEGTLPLRAGARVVGACASSTIVVGPSAPVASVVTVTSAGTPALVRDLTIRPTGQPGVVLEGAGRQIELESVVIEHATAYALYASAGAVITAHELVATDGEATTGGILGVAAVADGGATLAISRASFERARSAAVIASGPGTSVSLEDALVRDVEGQEIDGDFGRGLVAESGADVVFERVVIERTHDAGLAITDVGTTVALRASIVRDGLGTAATGYAGDGASVADGGHLEVRRSLFERNPSVGILATGAGASADIEDVVVRDGMSDAEGLGGGGVISERGAQLTATRLVVARTVLIGLAVFGPGATMSLVDTRIRDSRPRESDGMFGRALANEGVAVLDLTRVIVDGSTELGLGVSDPGGVVTATDFLIRDIESTPVDGELGRGINLQDGATGTFERVVVRDTRDVGISGIDSEMTFDDLVVEDTTERACVTTTCADLPFGHGIVVTRGAMTFRGFAVHRAAVCGVMVAEGMLDLERGEVSGSRIGACVQVPGYDLSRLSDEVRYFDNGINLDSTTLPVPTIVPPRGG